MRYRGSRFFRRNGKARSFLTLTFFLMLHQGESWGQSQSASASRVAAESKLSGQKEGFGARYLHPEMFQEHGRRLFSGMRSELSKAGILRVGSALPESSQLHSLAIPERLGSGILLYQAAVRSARPGTDLYFAESWTSPLRALGHLSFAVQGAFWGTDRAVLLTDFGALGLDIDLGVLLRSSPGVPLIGLSAWEDTRGQLKAFADFGMILQSQDDGISWSPFTKKGLDSPQDETYPSAKKRDKLVDEQRASDANSAGQHWTSAQLKELIFHGRRVESGWLALLQGYALRLKTEATELGQTYRVERWLEPLALGQSCYPLRSGYFYCVNKGQLLSFRNEFKVELTLGGNRQLLAQSRDTLLLSGDCESEEESGLCLVEFPSFRLQTLKPFANEQDHCDSKHQKRTLGYLAQGHRAVRLHLCGSVLHQLPLQEKQSAGSFPIKLAKSAFSARRRYGLSEKLEKEQVIAAQAFGAPFLLDEGWGFWMSQGDDFFGVQVLADSEMSLGPLQRGLARSSFADERAFLWGARGFAKESIDGGRSFQQRDYPHWPGDTTPASAGPGTVKVGCSASGCQVGEWLRFGWGPLMQQGARQELEPIRLSSSRDQGMPVYRCKVRSSLPTQEPGETSRESAVEPLIDEIFPGFTTRFSSFFSLPLTVLPSDKMGLELRARDSQVQIRVEGPRAESWGGQGKVRVSYQPPFTEFDSLVSVETEGIFRSSSEALDLLGEEMGASRRLQSALDLSGKGGVVAVRSLNSVLLLRFNANGVLRYEQPLGLRQFSLLSFLEGEQRAFLLVKAGARLILLSLDQEITELASFPLALSATHQAQLVSDQAGHLALFASGRQGLSLYPLTSDWRLAPGVHSAFLGKNLEHCPPSALGFAVDYESRIPPSLTFFSGFGQLRHLHQKLRLGYGPACVTALSAVVSGVLKSKMQPEPDVASNSAAAPGDTIPLVLENEERNRGAPPAWCRLLQAAD